ncbi:MAG: methyltransferase domain-containing protein [Prolixibacteraceae bacterium]|nr:methyltransferase domain-containing protein [Burkholderiales bacterium]
MEIRNSYQSRGINSYRLQALLDHGGQSILDVGCGSGAYVLALAKDRRIRGVDHARFDSWSGHEELFKIAAAAELPYDDTSFETVCSFEVLEHLQNPLEALREFHRVCTRNIVITVPNCEISDGMRRSNLLYSHWRDPTHCNFFDRNSIQQMVISAGFRIDTVYSINPISILPFLIEAINVPKALQSAFKTLIKPFVRGNYFLTTLVVASKV